ncbi:MAG: hypothetical protein KAX49_16150 [Halanaerobiales bacterium]|nr:hypothetical protein [Halanaerobiales bacterium]
MANLIASEYQSQDDKKVYIDDAQRKSLLNSIANIIPNESAAAENEFNTQEDLRKRFYPRQDHRFIFEADRFLILGQKGSGKTALFSVLAHPEYAKEVANYLEVSVELIEGTEWITGLKNSSEFPSKVNFQSVEDSSTTIRNYWRCLAARSILKNYESIQNVREEIKKLKNCSINELKEFAKDNSLAALIEDFFAFLQHTLERENKRIILVYDALDILISKEVRGTIISTLISLWFEYFNRYQNIRAKIFLREDIFKKEVGEGLDDKVKLRNYTTNLTWNYDSLLAMVWKRMAENSTDMAQLLETVLSHIGFTLSIPDEKIRYVSREDIKLNKELLKIIVGEKMGKGNKVYSYNWIRNHLADNQGTIVPRSILALFSYAAKREINQCGSKVDENTLISPKNFELVMKEVSEDSVSELLEEYGEYKNILKEIKNFQKTFPVCEDDLKSALVECGVESGKVKTTIDHLIEIGVLKSHQRKSSEPIRYHIPDIYLSGMGLTRQWSRYLKIQVSSIK